MNQPPRRIDHKETLTPNILKIVVSRKSTKVDNILKIKSKARFMISPAYDKFNTADSKKDSHTDSKNRRKNRKKKILKICQFNYKNNKRCNMVYRLINEREDQLKDINYICKKIYHNNTYSRLFKKVMPDITKMRTPRTSDIINN